MPSRQATMPACRRKFKDSQVISTELSVGLLLMTALRIIQRSVFYPEDQSPMEALSGFTYSLVCVWFASNVKFLLFKCDRHSLSLLAHPISRLVIAVLDVLLLSFCVTSTLIVMALGIGHLKGSLKHLGIFTKLQGIFLQMDSFACLLFGILWLMCPGWLLSPEGTVMLLMVLFHNQLTVWTSPCISVGLVLAGLWTGNSVLGYRASKEDHTGVSVEEIYKQSLQKKEHSYYIKV